MEKKFQSYPNCKVKRDEYNNIYVQVDPTKGMEKCPSICLQGHMDMVCAKLPGSTHDFKKDPIEIIIEDDNTIHANQTTLGADDAISISTMVAILENNVKHGPLEFLITTDEETNTIGALGFKPKTLKSKYLINLDTEHCDVVFNGCSGVLNQTLSFKLNRSPKKPKYIYMELTTDHMKGGHSGEEIHKKRANAIKVIFDVLYNLRFNNKLGVSLVSINGGQAKNAIPICCRAIFVIDKNDVKKAKEILKKLLKNYQLEFLGTDTPQISMKDSPHEKTKPILQTQSDNLIAVFNGIFNGIHTCNFEYVNAESSSNLGVIKTTDSQVTAGVLIRSFFDNVMFRIYNQIKSVAVDLGHGVSIMGEHMVPWTPTPGFNPLIKAYVDFAKKHLGFAPRIIICPGALEPGIINGKNPSIKYSISCGSRLEL